MDPYADEEEWLLAILALAFKLPVSMLEDLPLELLLKMHRQRLRDLCMALVAHVVAGEYVALPGISYEGLSSIPAASNFAWVRILTHGAKWRDEWLKSMSPEEQRLGRKYSEWVSFDVTTPEEYIFYRADRQLRLLMELHYVACYGLADNRDAIMSRVIQEYGGLMDLLPKLTAKMDGRDEDLF